MITPSLSRRAVAASAVALLAGAAFAGPAAADPGKGHGKGRPESGKPASKPSHETTPASHDPAGNNGTFKVDGLPYGDGMANEPHVTCGFRLKFFGFDSGQAGDVTVAGQAPSGSGVVSSRTDVPFVGALEYAASDLDLTGLTAQPRQGYHLKVTLATGEPGGVKHKVFWYEPCESAAVTTPTVAATEERTTEQSRETTTAPAEVLGVKLTRTSSTSPSGSAQVLGTTVTRSGGLPMTGSNVLVLGLAGLLLVAVGSGTVVAARVS
jgi:hypothetical protein